MKKILFIIMLILTIIAGAIFYGHMLDGQKEDITTNQIFKDAFNMKPPQLPKVFVEDKSFPLSIIHTAKTNSSNITDESSDKVISPKSTPISELMFEESFENGLSNHWVREMANDTYSGEISTKYAREGTYSYRIELHKSDPIVNGGSRSEIATAKPEAAADERTYIFSILLPKGGNEDYALDPKSGEIIAQWQNTPDPGEEWTYPPLSLHTSGDGHYYLYVCWDENPMSTEQKMDAEGKIVSYDLGTYLEDKGNWVDWKFYVRWGWLDSQNPLIQIYKNGTEIFELKDEPNTTNDQQGVVMKLGVYKWQWGQKNSKFDQSILTNRVIYYDNVSLK